LLNAVVDPDPAEIAAVEEAFVPLRLQLGDPHVRDLNVVWLPGRTGSRNT
jgi:hypothetical protein